MRREAIAAIALAVCACSRRPPDDFIVDVEGVACPRAAGGAWIRWNDVTRVTIRTTDEGPAKVDVFFVVEGTRGVCTFPHPQAVERVLIRALQERLPGLDNREVAVAMGSTENATFTIWPRQRPR